MDRCFIVDVTTAYNKGLSPDKVQAMPIPDLEKIASQILTTEMLVEKINLGEINTSSNFIVYRKLDDEEIHVGLGTYDQQEIIVNKDLQIHLHTTNKGYIADLYAYNEDTPVNERDYVNEFISSAYATYAELEKIHNLKNKKL